MKNSLFSFSSIDLPPLIFFFERVWQHREGRPESDVQEFLVMTEVKFGKAPFPGIIFLNVGLPEEECKLLKEDVKIQKFEDSKDKLECKRIVGYCCGGMKVDDTYEIVTAWIHNGYRGLGWAVTSYLLTMEHLYKHNNVSLVSLDVKKGND